MSQFDIKLRNWISWSINVIKSTNEDDDVGMSWLFGNGDVWWWVSGVFGWLMVIMMWIWLFMKMVAKGVGRFRIYLPDLKIPSVFVSLLRKTLFSNPNHV
jgi:hypothetical protein